MIHSLYLQRKDTSSHGPSIYRMVPYAYLYKYESSNHGLHKPQQILSGDSSTSLFHSKRMPFLSAKSKIPQKAVNLAYTSTYLMTESGMGYGVNARQLNFFPVDKLKNL